MGRVKIKSPITDNRRPATTMTMNTNDNDKKSSELAESES